MQERIAEYDLSHAALELYDFVYGELCDWYLEMVKPRLYSEGPERDEASAVVLHVLRTTLALAHPIIPFVTEEIWAYVPGTEGLLAGGRHPDADAALLDAEAEAEVGALIGAVQALRGWRDEVGVGAAERVPARLEASGYDALAEHVGRLARFEWSPDGGEPIATVAVPGGAVKVLASSALDPEEAARKREARAEHLRSEIERAERKLANEGFVAKAPPPVVDAERSKLDRLRAELETL
jgi:valyl-tRNA synthetase